MFLVVFSGFSFCFFNSKQNSGTHLLAEILKNRTDRSIDCLLTWRATVELLDRRRSSVFANVDATVACDLV